MQTPITPNPNRERHLMHDRPQPRNEIPREIQDLANEVLCKAYQQRRPTRRQSSPTRAVTMQVPIQRPSGSPAPTGTALTEPMVSATSKQTQQTLMPALRVQQSGTETLSSRFGRLKKAGK